MNYVLLGTTVGEGILGNVHGTDHDVGRHIGYEGHGAVHILVNLGTFDGGVVGDVEIVDILRNYIALRDVAGCLVCRRCQRIRISNAFCFLQSLL